MLDLFLGGDRDDKPKEAARPDAQQRTEGATTGERGTVFVGRSNELERLHLALDGAMAGNGSPVFLSGEPGAGKSTLMHRFLDEAQKRYPDAIVAVGECNSRSGPIDNCLPWKEILLVLTGNLDGKLAKQAGSSNNVRRIGQFAANTAAVVTEMAPDLIGTLIPGSLLLVRAGQKLVQKTGWIDTLSKISQSATNDLGPASIQQVNTSQLFESYARLLTALAGQNKLILGIDDLHWADAATISMLFHLSRAITKIPVLIVGTYRSNELGAGATGEPAQLETIVSTLRRYYGDNVVDLDFVERDAVLEPEAASAEMRAAREFIDQYLAANYKPQRLPEPFVSILLERSNANPLFLSELLTSLRERELLKRDDSGVWMLTKELTDADFPARVESIVQERLDRLPADRLDLLLLAAVEGSEFTVQMLGKIRPMPEIDLLKILVRELWQDHGLIRERGIDDSGAVPLTIYGFRSTSVQQYLYESLSAGERMVLHRLVGEALESLYADRADAFATTLAPHFEIARDRARLCHYALLAGREQLLRDGQTEARDWAQKALSAAQSESLVANAERSLAIAAAHELLGDVAERQAQYEEAEGHYSAALDVLPALADPEVPAVPDSVAAGVAAAAASSTGASAAAPSANQPLNSPATLSPSDVALRQILAQLQSGLLPVAPVPPLKIVSPLPSTEPLAVTFARLYRKIGATYGRRNEYDKVHHVYDAASAALARAQQDATGVTYERGQLLSDSGRLADVEGHPDEALRLYDSGLHVLEVYSNRWGAEIANLLASKGRVLGKAGRLDEARAEYQRAIALYKERNDRRGLANCETSLGVMDTLDCRWQDALAHFAQADDALSAVNDRYGLAMLANARGGTYANMSRYPEASATFTDGARVAEEIGAVAVGALNLLGLVRVSLDLDDMPAARRGLDGVLALMNSERRGISGILIGTYEGRILLEGRDYSGAEAALREALAMAEKLYFKEGQIDANLYLALTLLGRGDAEGAGILAAGALELAKELGYKTAILFAEQVLGQVAAARGQLPESRDHFERAIELARQLRSAYPYMRAISAYADTIENTARQRGLPLLAQVAEQVERMRSEAEEWLQRVRSTEPGGANHVATPAFVP